MSLVALCLRTAWVRALREQPLFGEAIYDQPNDPVALAIAEARPVIAVYSGEDTRSVTARDLIGADRAITLTIQAYLPAEVQIDGRSGPLEVNAKGNGGAILLSLLDRRIEQIVTAGTSPWAMILRSIMLSIKELRAAPYLIEVETGLRITAQEWVFTFDTLASPPIGEPPCGVWADLIAELRKEPELGEFSDLIAAAIENPAGLARWLKAAASLGLTEAGARGIGLGPDEDPAPEAPANV